MISISVLLDILGGAGAAGDLAAADGAAAVQRGGEPDRQVLSLPVLSCGVRADKSPRHRAVHVNPAQTDPLLER